MTDVESRIVSRVELARLIADRKNDSPLPAHDMPRPSWVDDPYDARRTHIRMRERRIRYLQNRLDGVKLRMERDFDQSS